MGTGIVISKAIVGDVLVGSSRWVVHGVGAVSLKNDSDLPHSDRDAGPVEQESTQSSGG